MKSRSRSSCAASVLRRTRVQRFLGAREPARRRRRELRDDPVRGRRKLGIVDALPDESPGRRLLGGDPVAEQRHSHRPRGADQPRQEIGAAGVGHEPELRERLDEARRPRGDHEIAGERDVGARAGGDAVDRADDRHRQRAQRQHQRLVVALDRRAEVDRRAARPTRRGRTRSCPAQKPRPAPVMSSTRADASARTAPRASRTSACIASLKLLRRSGRFSVRRAAPPSQREKNVLVAHGCRVSANSDRPDRRVPGPTSDVHRGAAPRGTGRRRTRRRSARRSPPALAPVPW